MFLLTLLAEQGAYLEDGQAVRVIPKQLDNLFMQWPARRQRRPPKLRGGNIPDNQREVDP
jgi:hypothetical protein